MLNISNLLKTTMLLLATAFVFNVNAAISNDPPTVMITSHTQNQTFPSNNSLVIIAADAADSDGVIAKVDFIVDGQIISSDTTAPYRAGVALEPGEHYIVARAYDNDGNSSFSLVNVNVTYPVHTTPSGTIQLTP